MSNFESQYWTEKIDFKEFGSNCAQYDHFKYAYDGSEDCLKLNIYVPKSIAHSSETVPVIFYIHGGAFMFGGGKLCLAENIMQAQNMILVTMNYRLGILGFMSTEDEVIPGNFGLKDQVAALQWIQQDSTKHRSI